MLIYVCIIKTETRIRAATAECRPTANANRKPTKPVNDGRGRPPPLRGLQMSRSFQSSPLPRWMDVYCTISWDRTARRRCFTGGVCRAGAACKRVKSGRATPLPVGCRWPSGRVWGRPPPFIVVVDAPPRPTTTVDDRNDDDDDDGALKRRVAFG